MIRNIIFDMGNVLINFRPNWILDSFDVSNADDRELLKNEVFKSDEWLKTDSGELTLDEAIESMMKRLPKRLEPTVINLVKKWWESAPLTDGMEELITTLKNNGYRIYVLSNTNLDYHSFKKVIPVTKLADGEFISAEHKLLKPTPEIYFAFLEKFALDESECFFVDDLEDNIKGAKSVGIDGHIFDGDVLKLKEKLQSVGVDTFDK